MNTDRMRTIKAVRAKEGVDLHLVWSNGTETTITLEPSVRAALGDARVGDWGHCVVWSNGTEWGADGLWLQSLSAIGRDDARQFLEWRQRNALSLSKSAEALGLARRTVAYYSNGERPVPKAILLACTGWEVGRQLQ